MLSNPGVGDLSEKVGNRYQISLAVAKRARQIAKRRLNNGSEEITDPVDVASKEISTGKTVVEVLDGEN